MIGALSKLIGRKGDSTNCWYAGALVDAASTSPVLPIPNALLKDLSIPKKNAKN
jgi:hypothetical protein